MELSVFKNQFQVENINLWKTKPGALRTHAGSGVSKSHGELSFMTTAISNGGCDFSKDIYVYEAALEVADETTGELSRKTVYVLSNKARKEADVSL